MPDFASIVMEATQVDEASDSDLEDLVLAEINRQFDNGCDSDGLVLTQLRNRCAPMYA